MDADDRLVASLFENLAESDWASAFLDGVCEATRSPAAAVLQVDVATGRQTLPAYVGQGRAAAEAFERSHSAGNPWRPPNETLGPPPGSVVIPDDRLPLSALRRTGFWADFLRPMGVDHGCGLIGFRSPQKVLSITLLRSSRVGIYGSKERAWLRGVAPHWVNACRLRDRLAPADRDCWDAARTLDRLGTAVFFLDERGRCHRWNAAGEALLRDGNLVRLRGGQLVAAHPGGGPSFLPTAAPIALCQRDGLVGGHATTHPLPGHGGLGLARGVVFVEPVETTQPKALRWALGNVFGLTPREAELAERLANGSDLAQVAAAMGVSKEGARTRLKVVYGKTGARHQAALVVLVRSLNAVLGQNTTDV
ncbi:MAG: helix-turn-helix transcriptional regulator [Rhodanobacteraceae bacterium]|nr:helix-turn-helix transcriptional regulator [Rhodanobacteraceae bacterium]